MENERRGGRARHTGGGSAGEGSPGRDQGKRRGRGNSGEGKGEGRHNPKKIFETMRIEVRATRRRRA